MRTEEILFAEFEERVFNARKDNLSYNKEFYKYAECLKFIEEIKAVGYEPNIIWGNIEYHTNWAWLMPIVEKIESLHLNVQISGNNCFISWMGAEPEDMKLLSFLEQFKGIDIDNLSKIKATSDACIEFITQYNAFYHENRP